jgi:hypothetical protein
VDLWQWLGLVGVLALWGAVALVPWVVALATTRGRALALAPIALLAGVAGGALIPALGAKDVFGFWLSLGAAAAASIAALTFVADRNRATDWHR